MTSPAIPELNTLPVLFWFSGKFRERAEAALRLLNVSLANGYWEPKSSKHVRATLNKAMVAIKFARSEEAKALDDLLSPQGRAGWACKHAMEYGLLANVLKLNPDELQPSTPKETEAVGVVKQFWAAFTPVAEALRELDSRRPPPVFTSIGVSPTLTRTLEEIQVDASPDTIRLCPVRWEAVTRPPTTPGGRPVTVIVGILLWPDGTIHGASRYARGTNNNQQCHACGHAIKNSSNWVPLIATGRNGKHLSLWVGRDCAKSLFGVDMRGEAAWEKRMA